MTYKVVFFDVGGRDMMEIRTLTDDKSSVIRKVNEADIEAFPAEWAAYQTGGKPDYGGTPITELVADPKTGRKVEHSFAAAMALKGVHNIEMLAGLPDIAAQHMGMGIFTLRKRAIAHMEEQKRIREAVIAAQAAAPRHPEPVNMGTGRGGGKPKADRS